MLFSSFTFIFAFLPIVWAIFRLLKRARFKAHYESAKIFLIISSLFFYAFWKVAYLPILLGSIIVNYTLAKMILKSNSKVSFNNATTLGGGGNQHLDSNPTSSLRVRQHEAIQNHNVDCHESLRDSRNDDNEHFSNDGIRFTPKFYFILGIIFNLSLLAFFKYTDFLLENFNAFSKLTHLDFSIPLPHILLPLALSFVTFQQIAFLFDCFKRTKGELDENLHIDFIDYALFISFFPQLIAGPIVHHREMMPQFAKIGANSACGDFSRSASAHFVNGRPSPISSFASHNHENSHTILEFADSNVESTNQAQNKNNPSLRSESMNSPKQSIINYEFLAKGIFIFSIGLFKKAFIADSFAKWANAGFKAVESGGVLNIAESWATSLSYTFQLYFDFSGYCDMAIGLALMFGIVLPLNFDSPYKSLNISEFWRRWHITLGRFLKECVYIPLGGNRGKGNSSLTQSSRELEKSSIDRQQALSQSDFSTQPTNLAQDTRIANDSQKQSKITKILTLRNLFIVAFLSGVWHGAGWGFVIWGVLHGVAMMIHRIYSWWLANSSFCDKSGRLATRFVNRLQVLFPRSWLRNPDFSSKILEFASCKENAKSVKAKFLRFTKTRFYKCLCWLLTFNFVNLAWIFFRSENLNGAVNLIKGMFGFANLEIPHKWNKIFSTLQGGTNEIIIWIVCGVVVCVVCRNSFEKLQNFSPKLSYLIFITLAFSLALASLISQLLDANEYTPFLYFNF